MLKIKNLSVSCDRKKILNGINLNLEKGKIHVLMGPNGSGKSTLANAIMGNPKYEISKGEIIFNGKNILKLSVEKRARQGIFLSFQNPIEISGISLSNFLRQTYNAINKKKISFLEFKELLEKRCAELGINSDFLNRYLNGGFSGGEKKKTEILQMLVLNPKIAILDETDSGLDIDSLKLVSKGISKFITNKKSILIITHYKRIFEYIKPDKVHIMSDGKIIKQGNKNLIDYLEKEGYNWIKKF